MKKSRLKVLIIPVYHFENMGVRLLQSVIQKEGHDCKLLFFNSVEMKKVKRTLLHAPFQFLIKPDAPVEEDYIKLQKFIEGYKPDIIGISSMSENYSTSIKICNKIKEVSKAPIVWGGVHATVAPEECVAHADFVCIGEGVESFPEFINSFENGKNIKRTKGFAYQNNGKTIINKSKDPVANLNTLPYADYTNENKYYIKKG